jgi:hypothetical protein
MHGVPILEGERLLIQSFADEDDDEDDPKGSVRKLLTL